MCVCVRERESERERRRENMSGPSRIGKLYRDFKKWGEGQNFSLGHFYKRLLGFFFFPSGKILPPGPCRCDPSSHKDFFPFRKIWFGIFKREGGKEERKRRQKRKEQYIFHFVEEGRGVCPRPPLGDIAGGDQKRGWGV